MTLLYGCAFGLALGWAVVATIERREAMRQLGETRQQLRYAREREAAYQHALEQATLRAEAWRGLYLEELDREPAREWVYAPLLTWPALATWGEN